MSTVEKPKEPKSNLAVIGVCAFNSSFFEVYPNLELQWRNQMEIMNAISVLIDSGYKVVSSRVEGSWKNAGKPECVLEVNGLTLDGGRDISKSKVDGSRWC